MIYTPGKQESFEIEIKIDDYQGRKEVRNQWTWNIIPVAGPDTTNELSIKKMSLDHVYDGKSDYLDNKTSIIIAMPKHDSSLPCHECVHVCIDAGTVK